VTAIATDHKRVVRTYRQTIEAPPEVVFPLLCPVREAEWLDGWRFTMVYSASGLVEDSAVFTTPAGGEADTVWIVSRYEPDARRVDFTRVTPGSRTCLLKLAVSPCERERSHVDISYTYTSMTPAGDAFIDAWTADAFAEAMVFWERSMNHFLKTGHRLTRTGG
jgi:hypothetical protein